MSGGRQWLTQASRAVKPLGWPGALGVLCLMGAAFLVWGWTPLLQRQAAELESQTDRREREQRLDPLGQPTQVARTGQSPQEWLARIPPSTGQQDRLLNLIEAALHSGVQTVRSEHRVTQDPATGLVRLRVTMPVKGTYGQIRQFIGAALLADDALSLDSVKLRRTGVPSSEVDGELQWSLYSVQQELSP